MRYEKNIKIDENTWYTLARMKIDKRLDRIADVIKLLIEENQQKSQNQD